MKLRNDEEAAFDQRREIVYFVVLGVFSTDYSYGKENLMFIEIFTLFSRCIRT